jgi:CheY-like chemotaxis protein
MAVQLDQSVHIILIDDDDVDVEAVARLLRRQRLPHTLTVFANGRDAQHALAGSFGRDLLAQRYLILLDLNMPRMNGFEFLDWLRSMPHLLRSIVFVFTTSEAPTDRHRAYERQVAGYLAKPRLGPGYADLLPLLASFSRQVSFPPPVRSIA